MSDSDSEYPQNCKQRKQFTDASQNSIKSRQQRHVNHMIDSARKLRKRQESVDIPVRYPLHAHTELQHSATQNFGNLTSEFAQINTLPNKEHGATTFKKNSKAVPLVDLNNMFQESKSPLSGSKLIKDP